MGYTIHWTEMTTGCLPRLISFLFGLPPTTMASREHQQHEEQTIEVDESSDHDNEEEARNQATQQQEEVLFYFRFLRCIVIVTAGWFIFLLCLYVPKQATMDTTTEFLLFVMGCIILVAGALVCCCAPNHVHNHAEPQQRQRRHDFGSEQGGLMDSNEDDGTNTEEYSQDFPYAFAETAIRIRQSALDDDTFDDEEYHTAELKEPIDGNYKLICTAIYFGKTIRSEGHVELYFTQTNDGWDVQGTQLFQTSKRPLIDGFLAKRNGRIYWIVPMPAVGHCVYRGIFDFERNGIYDGEFKSKTGPRGRIVRLERIETPVGVSSSNNAASGITGNDVEMVPISSKPKEIAGGDSDAQLL